MQRAHFDIIPAKNGLLRATLLAVTGVVLVVVYVQVPRYFTTVAEILSGLLFALGALVLLTELYRPKRIGERLARIFLRSRILLWLVNPSNGWRLFFFLMGVAWLLALLEGAYIAYRGAEPGQYVCLRYSYVPAISFFVLMYIYLFVREIGIYALEFAAGRTGRTLQVAAGFLVIVGVAVLLVAKAAPFAFVDFPGESSQRCEEPPNKALQPTLDPSVLFAGAKSPPASSAAELGR